MNKTILQGALFTFFLMVSAGFFSTTHAQEFNISFSENPGCSQNCNQFSVTVNEVEFEFIFQERPSGGGHFRYQNLYGLDNSPSMAAVSENPDNNTNENWIIRRSDGQPFNFNSIYVRNKSSIQANISGSLGGGSPEVNRIVPADSEGVYNFNNTTVDRININGQFSRSSSSPPEFTFDAFRGVVPTPPTVATDSPTSINTTSASLGGNVTDDGGVDVTERGIVYSTSPDPDLDDNEVQIGVGTGDFSETVSGLDPGITYYVRAYATNFAGTAYGGQDSFTTPVEISSINRQSPSQQLTNRNQVEYEVNLTGQVSDLGTTNFSLTQSGGVSGSSVTSVSGSGSTYQVTVNTGSGDGTLRLNVENSTDTSPTIVGLPFTSGQSYTIDKTAPTITSITAQQPGLTNETDLVFELVFSEDMTEPVAGNFDINNGSFSSISGSGDTWTLVVNPDDVGAVETITVQVLQNGAEDLAGNVLGNTESASVDYDGVPPTVTISSDENSPTNADPIPVKIDFSEVVTGLAVEDITVGGGTASNLAGSGANYTVDVIPTGDGIITVDLAGGAAQDAAGNDNTAAAQFSIDYDDTAPTVTSLSGPVNNATNQTSFDVTVNFSEAVENFSTAVVDVTGGSVESITEIDPDEYRVTIKPENTNQGQDYDINIQIGAGAVQDLAGNENEESAELTVNFDTTNLTAAITGDEDPGPTNAASFEATIAFNKPVWDFDVSDITTDNASLSGFTGDDGDESFTVTVEPNADGEVTLDLAADVVQDAAGNDNLAASQFSIVSDQTPPTITSIERSAGLNDPTTETEFNVLITFSEEIPDFAESDLSVTNGSATGFTSADNIEFTVTIEPDPVTTSSATIEVGVPADVFTDQAGNRNETDTENFTIEFGDTRPTAALTSAEQDPTNADDFEVTLNITEIFGEPVSSIDASDFTISRAEITNIVDTANPEFVLTIEPQEEGEISIQLNENVLTDAAGNQNEASNEFTIVYDISSPDVSIATIESDPTNADDFEVTFTFTKPVDNFTQGDISVTNAQLSNFTGDDGDTEYTVTVAPDGDGLVTLDVPEGSAQDAAGNDNTALNTFEIFSDRTVPEVTSIEAEAGVDDPTTETEFNVLITFSEEITDFDEQMLIIDNADLIDVNTADQIEYVLTISPMADGEVQVTAPEALGEDPAGNESEAAAVPFSITYFGTPTQVVLKLPEDEESDLALSPEFSWEAVNLADSYNLEISTDVDFDPSDVVYTATDIVETKYLIQNELSYDERHFWRVQADNEGFSGEWSDVRSFVTIPEPPAAVVLESPNNEQIDVLLQPEFRWEETDRAVAYQLQVSTTDSFDDPVINQTEIDETLWATEENLDTEQVHFWRVRGINAGGNGEWSTVQTFTTQPAPPVQVVLMSPENKTGSVELTAELEWEEADRATQYRLQISTDSQFDDVISEVEDIGTTTYTVDDGLHNFETYYWQVQAENSGGFGEWSEGRRFITEAAVPEMSFPANNAGSISIAPELRWESDHEDVEFEVRMGRSESLDQREVEMTTDNLNAQLSSLDTATEYFWSVRVVAEETTSSWSDARSFTTRAPFKEQERVTQTITIPQESSNTIASEDYRLLAIPGSEEMYVDELFTGPYSDEWRAFVDNGANDDFLEEYDEENNRLKIGGGRGLWVYNREEVATEIDIIQLADENDVFPIELHSGWNIISNPFANPVRWSEVMEYNEIDTDLYQYGSIFSLATEMVPFEGYYFYNDPDFDMDELYIPVGELEDRRMKKPTPTNLQATDIQPTLRFRGYLPGSENEREQIASVELAVVDTETGKGQSPHPSLNSSHYGAVFVVSDERASMRSLRTDELVYDREGSEHQLSIKAPVGSRLTWETDFEDLSAHAAVLMVNPVTNRSYLIKPGDIVDIDVTEPRIDYDMYVGDEAYLLEIQENLIPEEITLEDNYPNPFNHQSIIRYALVDDDEVDVRLDVFDVLGRRVQTLVNERQSSGWYTETFNGAGLASGVYLYRLIADGEVLTGKMMLVK